MSKVQADNYPRSISQYVPNMEFAADVVEGKHFISLGAPSTADPNGILVGASATDSATAFTSSDWATTFDGSSTHIGESVAGKVNAKYGRCLDATGTAGSNHVITVIGRDYLGQRMRENITLSGTLVIKGNKAFAYVDNVNVAAGAASDTFDLGWTNRLGLPYKAEKMITYTEDDVSFPVDPVEVALEVDAVRFAAGTDTVVPSPIAGQVTGVNSVVTTATTGASTATVVVVAVDVVGLSIVIAGSASVGDQDSDTATTDDDQATSRVDKFEALGISPDSTPSAGAANYVITVEPITFVAGPDTDPQTATTEDPRGTILVTTPCDASISYEVGYSVDTGDLHGVEQFNG
jgi:hypothetical protein